MSSPLHFVDSQDEEEMQLESVVSPSRPPPSIGSLQPIAESKKGVPLSPDPRKAAALQGSSSQARRGVKTTPKARLRHDDSQIQFAAIESSPLQPEPLESQHLTDRQKEVKERQVREAAAMFPEIRSSPRSTPRHTNYNLPKLVFKSTPNPVLNSTIDEATSPTYLPDALMNSFLGSSPTPSSKRSSDRHSDDDPPSSPPFVSSNVQTNQLTELLQAPENYAPGQVIANAEQCPENRFANESLPGMEGHSSNGECIGAVVDAPGPVNDQEDASKLKTPQVPVGDHPMSDFDIYVDASSVPSLNESSTEHNDNQPDDVNSFQSEGSSRFSIEDDQVTAQLITEMERASQQSTKQDETTQSAQGVAKKRKRTADSPNVNKKTKRTPASSDPQAATGFPGTGETVADCVMIDVREDDRSRPFVPQQIKREQSASPSIFTSTQAVEETPVAQMRPAESLRKSQASQSSSQEQDTPMTAKNPIGRPRGSRNSQVKLEEAETEKASAPRKSARVSERLGGSTSNSPHMSAAVSQEPTKGGQWLALGKTPRRGMFRWLRHSSAESDDLGTRPDPTPAASSTSEVNAERVNEQFRMQGHDLLPADLHPEHDVTRHNRDRVFAANQHGGEAQPEASGAVETEGDIPTAQGILQHFQNMLNKIKRVTFGPEEERAMVGILFESVKEVHEAGRRHVSM